jgi:DNA-binding GntR family transcriptional regulator
MTPKRDRVAQLVRARIERGDYADGQHLVQSELAAQCGVTRHVVWYALADLQDEGFVSPVRLAGQDRYLANALHVSRQLQKVLNLAERLDLMEKQVTALCRYLVPTSGRYAAPGTPPRWR